MNEVKHDDSIDEAAVISWLEQHPDIFQRQPGLLDELQLTHHEGTNTASLIERQVARLRTKNSEIERKMQQMMQNALENEKLMGRLHRLTLDLGETHSLPMFFELLRAELKNSFASDHVYIGLLGDNIDAQNDLAVDSIQADDPELLPFRTLLDGGSTSCGRLAREKLQFLFGRDNQIRSTALVPIGKNSELGMLAIGSEDPGRFFPGMGTMFLELLSETISHRLNLQELTPQRLSA